MAIGFHINSYEGQEGQIIVPAIGAVVGRLSSWSMRRKGDDGPFVFRAQLAYLNEALFKNEEITKHVLVRMTKSQQYRVCGDRMAISNNTLLMENASLCPPE